MFHSLGRFTSRNAWVVCLGWVVAGLLLTLAAPRWDTRTEDDDIRFIPERCTSVRAHRLMAQAFPQEVSASKLVFALERADGPLAEGDFKFADQLIHQLSKLALEAPELKIGKLDCYRDGLIGARLTSMDGKCTLIVVSLSTPYLALATQVAVDRATAIVHCCDQEAGRPGLQVFTTGCAAIGHDANKVCEDSLDSTSRATVILVLVVLLAVYRAPLLALIPLMTIGVSVWVALNLLALMTLLPGVHLVNISKLFAIVILYGAGTDYSLFLISRYLQELELGSAPPDALARSVGGVGGALTASAGTVMAGLALMALAEFAKVRHTGPAIALSLGVALAASLTLTPALLWVLGRSVFWPRQAPRGVALLRLVGRTHEGERTNLWDRVSRVVARRPVLVWSIAAGLLLPLIILGLQVEPSYRATGELSPRAESLQGLTAIQRHFTPGEVGPISVLLVSSKDWTSREGLRESERLSRGFASLPGIAEVRSLTQPLGIPLPDLPAPAEEGLWQELLSWLDPHLEAARRQMIAGARDLYTARIDHGRHFVNRFDVVLETDPWEPESAETLQRIQTWLRADLPSCSLLGGDVAAEYFGVTSSARDLAEVTEADRCRVNSLVLLAIFGILVVLVRRLGLALYMLATVLVSYYAALGATVLVGIAWNGALLTTFDWRVPFFLFTILVAVGEDYNILLVSRALEESKRHSLAEAMRRALACTGGAITSCGLIMAGTFATLMLTGLPALLQMGFALAFGVLVDTFVVRPFLLPALLMYCWAGRELDVAPAERSSALPQTRRAA